MNLLGWIVVGFVAAAIAGRLTNRRDGGCITKIVVGVIGAFIGGALDNAAGGPGIGDFGLRSIVLAAIGATVFLSVLNAIESGRLRR
jgi:uncharacterized membrane protein YeaQ/YmgE (transglycosylase-associated protein family)